MSSNSRSCIRYRSDLSRFSLAATSDIWRVIEEQDGTVCFLFVVLVIMFSFQLTPWYIGVPLRVLLHKSSRVSFDLPLGTCLHVCRAYGSSSPPFVVACLLRTNIPVMSKHFMFVTVLTILAFGPPCVTVGMVLSGPTIYHRIDSSAREGTTQCS